MTEKNRCTRFVSFVAQRVLLDRQEFSDTLQIIIRDEVEGVMGVREGIGTTFLSGSFTVALRDYSS